MIMKVAKEFIWEMSHRLPFHDGPCKNIHGHTYKLRLECEGEPDENMMIIDYYQMKSILEQHLNSFDHAFICDKDDTVMIDFLKANNFKYYILPFYSTAENLVSYILHLIAPDFKKFDNIVRIKARIYETSDVYAEQSLELN